MSNQIIFTDYDSPESTEPCPEGTRAPLAECLHQHAALIEQCATLQAAYIASRTAATAAERDHALFETKAAEAWQTYRNRPAASSTPFAKRCTTAASYSRRLGSCTHERTNPDRHTSNLPAG